MAGMAGQRFEAKRERTKAEAEQLCFHGLFWLGLAGLAPRRQFFARELISCMLHQAGCRARKRAAQHGQEVGMHAPAHGCGGVGVHARMPDQAAGGPSPSMVAVGRGPEQGF